MQQILAEMPKKRWPHLVERSCEHVLQPRDDDGQERDLDRVLDGLERARSGEGRAYVGP